MHLKDKKKEEHLEKTIKGFTYNIVGVILPFILSLLPIMLFGKYEAILKFLDQGGDYPKSGHSFLTKMTTHFAPKCALITA